LYSQFHGLSDRATRTDDRINNAGNAAEEKVNQIVDKMDELDSKMNGYAKLMDLEDFVLKDTFADAQAKANTMADQFNEELSTKAPISMLDDLVDQGEIQRLKDWVNTLRSQMENVPTKDDLAHLDLYVKWPQLEDALFHYPSRLSKQTSRSSFLNDSQNGSIQNGSMQNGYGQNSNRKKSSIQNDRIDSASTNDSQNGSIQNGYGQYSNRKKSSIQNGRNDSASMNDSQNGSIQNGYGQNAYDQNGNRKKSSIQNGDIKNGRNGSISNEYNQSSYDQDDRSSQNSSPPDSRPGSRSSKRKSTSSRKLYPTDACVQKLNELGSMADRQNALMDALERTREQLADKADKSELSNFVTQEDLNDLLLLLKNLQEEVNGLQAWRTIVDDEKVPALRDLLSDLEQQVADLLDHLAHLQDEDKSKAKALENLFTYVDRLEANKLDKDDPLIQELKYATNKNLPPILTPSTKENDNNNKSTSESLDKQDGTSDNEDKSLANQGDYDDDIKKLNDLIKKLQDKINNMEISYDKSLNDILNELDDKLDRAELQPLREYLENRYNTLSQQQQQQEPSSPSCSTPHKPHKPKSRSTNEDYDPSFTHNIPTDLTRKPVSGGKTYKAKSAPTSKQPSRMSGVYYDNDMLGCSHPHYGDGGFVPLKKNAAVMRSQMKFNCLSCDRPLTMQADSHFQTVRGKDRQLTGYELDQLKLLQRILKGDNPNKATRACGGRHTSSIPPSSAKKLTPKFNSTFPSVNTDYIVATDDLVDNEIDIEGLDGRFYRGLLSRKDIPSNHDRSRSANANLRTVSPSPKRGTDRPISGMDCNSSFTSGLGTTHGSMDIHIH